LAGIVVSRSVKNSNVSFFGDLENAMKIELLEGENVPPPEYRRMGPNMLAICAEQLKEFLQATWIYKEAARTAAPVLMVKTPKPESSG